MSDRRERIPAAEVPDPKLWKLPFWTEPKHIVHAEEVEEDESEVLIEEEEIEIEPLTAEQLENIRQEAYNEGLEQGLVEGRQKGEKQGFEAGHLEGLEQGKVEGKKQGYDEGYQSGEKSALAEGDNLHAELTSRIHSNLRNIETTIDKQTSSIEALLPDLVMAICQAVVTEELDQGSEHIVNIVQLALNALPTNSKSLTIECNPVDMPFFESSNEFTKFDGMFKENSQIQPGGCKIHSEFSSVDFTQSERWQSVIKQYQHQLQVGISNVDEIQQSQKETDALTDNESEKNAFIDHDESLSDTIDSSIEITSEEQRLDEQKGGDAAEETPSKIAQEEIETSSPKAEVETETETETETEDDDLIVPVIKDSVADNDREGEKQNGTHSENDTPHASAELDESDDSAQTPEMDDESGASDE